MSNVKVLAFAGSSRLGSYNARLLTSLEHDVASAGGVITPLDLRDDLALPLYDADLEQRSGVPLGARRLQKLFAEHAALIIACPEYNGGLPPLLKNALDWVSRPLPGHDEPNSAAFRGKVVGIVSASPGSGGAAGAANHLADLLRDLRAEVVDPIVSLQLTDTDFSAGELQADHAAWPQLRELAESVVARASAHNVLDGQFNHAR
ncbi:MAG: NAD(P)H-dependent oxidoreductase [Planctomycetota bacterium]|jgi:chromate reductase|nr:NAD(P)H-dependent oxidoreductase [Planctomycetota bacterium]